MLPDWARIVLIIQMLTLICLAVAFFKVGNWRLGIAQCCYAVATVVIFF